MYDENFVFSLVFFLFSYKLLFWSQRNISIGVLLLTVCCALSATQLMFPHAHKVLFSAFAERLQSMNTSQRVQDTFQTSLSYVRSCLNFVHRNIGFSTI